MKFVSRIEFKNLKHTYINAPNKELIIIGKIIIKLSFHFEYRMD